MFDHCCGNTVTEKPKDSRNITPHYGKEPTLQSKDTFDTQNVDNNEDLIVNTKKSKPENYKGEKQKLVNSAKPINYNNPNLNQQISEKNEKEEIEKRAKLISAIMSEINSNILEEENSNLKNLNNNNLNDNNDNNAENNGNLESKDNTPQKNNGSYIKKLSSPSLNNDKKRLTYQGNGINDNIHNHLRNKVNAKTNKLSEKQKEFAKKILNTNLGKIKKDLSNNNTHNNHSNSNRKNPYDLKSYSLLELELVYNRFIQDQEFLRNINKGNTSILPLNNKLSIQDKLNYSSLGTQEFEIIRNEVYKANNEELIKKHHASLNNSYKKQILPKDCLDYNIQFIDYSFDSLKPESPELTNLRIKIYYINKFHHNIKEKNIYLNFEDDSNANNKTNNPNSLENHEYVRGLTKDFHNNISLLEESKIENHDNVLDKTTNDIITLKFHNFKEHEDDLDETKNKNNISEKEHDVILKVIFMKSIEELFDLRTEVQRKLNDDFLFDLKERIDVNNKSLSHRYTIVGYNNDEIIASKEKIRNLNKYYDNALILRSKGDEDELENERIKFYSEIKEELINEDNYAGQDTDFGNIF